MKKGQAGGAAALIAVIGAIIILYILFLPPAEREALLGDNDTDNNNHNGNSEGNNTLLLEHPGRLDVFDQQEIEHTVPSINLFTITRAEILKKVTSIYVKNGWFDKSFKETVFAIDDVENTHNAVLSFLAKKARGRLMVTLNDYEVYNGVITSINAPPIELSDDFLREENTIKFSVSGVGWRFWTTNEYEMEKVEVKADVTDVSAQESRNIFVVTSTERDNAKRAFLKFFAECNVLEVGVLNILLNNHNLFSAVPDCGMRRSFEFSPQFLLSGENRLVFKAEKGHFLIDSILVKTELTELTYPVYYFELNQDQYDDIINDVVDIKLKMRFPDDIVHKQAKVYVNGHLTHLDTYESSYEKDMEMFVDKGNNAVEVVPTVIIDITTLEVVLE